MTPNCKYNSFLRYGIRH